MASLAEMLVAQSGQKIDFNQGADYAGNLRAGLQTGAEIAQRAEQMRAQRAQLEQKKAELEGAKMDKFLEAFQKGANYTGTAQKKYFEQVLPRYRDSLGLNGLIADDELKFVTATPENRARIATLVDDVRNGRRSVEEVTGIIKDPVSFADVPQEFLEATYKEVGEAGKQRAENIAQERNTQITAAAAMGRQVQGQQEAGNVEVRKKTGADFTQFNAAGGLSSAQAKIEKLRAVEKQLVEGKVELGTKKILAATKAPFVGGETALAKVDPKVKAMMDEVRSSIGLKGQLDSQFSAKEAESVFGRAFDPNLDNKANLNKVRALRKELENDLKNKIGIFEQQGFAVPEAAKAAASGVPAAGNGMVKVGSTPMPIEKAKAFLKANPQFLNQVDPATRRNLGL